jgi:uncharacterized LabA/DUF88 family protein
MANKKKAIVFIDGNNWYHNVKSIIKKPRQINFKKLSSLISEKFDFNVIEIRYYNSVPDIGLGEENYYKHMVFLNNLKKQGIVVNTRKLKKMKVAGEIVRVEKGIDVMISSDMVLKTHLENKCDCCVLITGDSDYIPMMQLIKKLGKEVLTVSVMKGYARELLKGDFRYWILKKQDLNKCTNNN